MFKVNNKDTKTTSMAYFTPCSDVSIVNFEQVNADWVRTQSNIYDEAYLRKCLRAESR